MMTNLFSSFDPQSFPFLSLNWTIAPISMMILPKKFWISKNSKNLMMSSLQNKLMAEMKPILSNNLDKGTILIPTTIIILIALQNTSGLFPYVFTYQSHICVTLSMALPMWMTLMMFGWTKKTNQMFAHLVPQSSPYLLIPFMIMIETTSNTIRPITLSVRLTANLTAGHLIITLIENSAMSSNHMMPFTITITTQIILYILETAVALIQAYVFSILMMLYVKEIN